MGKGEWHKKRRMRSQVQIEDQVTQRWRVNNEEGHVKWEDEEVPLV